MAVMVGTTQAFPGDRSSAEFRVLLRLAVKLYFDSDFLKNNNATAEKWIDRFATGERFAFSFFNKILKTDCLGPKVK